MSLPCRVGLWPLIILVGSAIAPRPSAGIPVFAIPAHEVPHIFDEFRQVDGSMSRDYGGIGLGLALVRKLTALLNGEVSVSSVLERGSTFTVRVPLHAQPVMPAAAVSAR